MDNHKSQDDYMEDPIEPQANRLPLSNETIEIDSGSVDLQDFDTASFPINDYRSMHSQLRGLSWRVPVLPNDCLETVLLACIRLAKSGHYEQSFEFANFCYEDLNVAFEKIICDRAGCNWDGTIRHYIYMNSLLAVELCATMADKDYGPILELETILFNPQTTFQRNSVLNSDLTKVIQHGVENVETVSRFSHLMQLLQKPFTRSEDGTTPFQSRVFTLNTNGLPLLDDFINLFGRLGGFDAVRSRLVDANTKPATLSLIFDYLKPFELCCYYLTHEVLNEYLRPLAEKAIELMNSLTDEDICQLIRKDPRSNHLKGFSVIRTFYQCLYGPDYQDPSLDNLRLGIILKTMRISLFAGKMNALMDLLTIINCLNFMNSAADSPTPSEQETITSEHLIGWLKDNQVLSLLLRENLHQTQYVDKVTQVIRFLVESRALSLEDLGEIWEAQVGKHETIVKNVEDMLANLVIVFTPEQHDHLFKCFKVAFETATKRQRERLVNLILRLTLEERHQLVEKALQFLWDLAIRPCFFADIATSALIAHKSILTQPDILNDSKLRWLSHLAKVLKDDSNDYAVLCAARLITDIAKSIRRSLYSGIEESPIHQMVINHGLIDVCITSLQTYMRNFSHKEVFGCATPKLNNDSPTLADSKGNQDTGFDSVSSYPATPLGRCEIAPTSPTGTLDLPLITSCDEGVCQGVNPQLARVPPVAPIPHVIQIKERLLLLQFLATESGAFPSLKQLNLLWQCLLGDQAEQLANQETTTKSTATSCDLSSSMETLEARDFCFSWFNPISNDLIRLHANEFFTCNLLGIDPEALTPSGMTLFRCFFNHVNGQLDRIQHTEIPNAPIVLRNPDLLGLEYLWRLVLRADEQVARVGIEILQQLYTNLDSRLLGSQRKLHSDFLDKCFKFLAESYTKVKNVLSSEGTAFADSSGCQLSSRALPRAQIACSSKAGQEVTNMDRIIQVLRCFLVECDQQFQAPRQRLPLFQSWCGSALTMHVTFERVEKGSIVDDQLLALGITDGSKYKSASHTVTTQANETLARLRARLLRARLQQLLDADSSNFNSSFVCGGGDDQLGGGASALDKQISALFGLELCEVGSNLPGNICLSTYLLILTCSNGDAESLEITEEEDEETSSRNSLADIAGRSGGRGCSGGGVGNSLPKINLTGRLYTREAISSGQPGSSATYPMSSAQRQHYNSSSSVENDVDDDDDDDGGNYPNALDCSLAQHGGPPSASSSGNSMLNSRGSTWDPTDEDDDDKEGSIQHSPVANIKLSDEDTLETKRRRCKSAAAPASTIEADLVARSASANKPLQPNAVGSGIVGTNQGSTAGGDCESEVPVLPSPTDETSTELLLPDVALQEFIISMTGGSLDVSENRDESGIPGNLIAEKSKFVRLLMDIGNLSVFLGLQSVRDGVFDVLFSLPVSSHYQGKLCDSLSSREGFSGFCEMLKRSPCELTLPTTTQSLSEFEFSGCTQQLYFLQVLYATLFPSVAPDYVGSSVYENEEASKHMLSFLRYGGLNGLLSAAASFEIDVTLSDGLGNLLLMWMCRIASLALHCTLATLDLVVPDSQMGVDGVTAERINSFCKAQCGSCEDQHVLGRAKAFAIYARSNGATLEEIQKESHWLPVRRMSGEVLRNVCWLASSASLGSGALASANITRPASAPPSFMHEAMIASAVPRTLVDSGSTSPLVNSCHHATRSSGCTFSTSCGLHYLPLRSFLQCGHLTISPAQTAQCLRLLLPPIASHVSSGSPSPDVSIQSALNPALLALRSGCTPGCLSLDSLEAMSLLLSLSPDTSLLDLLKSCSSPRDYGSNLYLQAWFTFLQDLLVNSPSELVRQAVQSRATTLVTRGLGVASALEKIPFNDRQGTSIWSTAPIEFAIQVLFTALDLHASDKSAHTTDYADVLIQLLHFLHAEKLHLRSAEELFKSEWAWLSKSIRIPSPVNGEKNAPVSPPAHLTAPSLVCSHLRLCAALLPFQRQDLSHGLIPIDLVQAILEVVIFPASKRFVELCQTDATTLESAGALLSVGLLGACPDAVLKAAFNLLLELATYAPNLCLPHIANSISTLVFAQTSHASNTIHEMMSQPILDVKLKVLDFSSANPAHTRRPVTEWESTSNAFNLSPNRERHSRNPFTSTATNGYQRNNWSLGGVGMDGSGFVGLRNAGATCYMNSVLQQFFAILPIRNAVLSAPVTESLERAGIDVETLASTKAGGGLYGAIGGPYGGCGPTAPRPPENCEFNESQLSNLCMLHSLQDMFAFLAYTRRKYYDPRPFLNNFKLWGERVNSSEQHDAQEFFSCFVDTVDEAMKLCGVQKTIENIMGGVFEDQKICIDCPHRYQREETFLAISVDIHNHSSLRESLENYVKSDLLEGDNAYHCDQCNKKVAVRKRTCVKRLPQVLAIQLKRFSYDWERHVAVKSNDYLAFPRELDMAPYTVEGLANLEATTTESTDGNATTSGSPVTSHPSPGAVISPPEEEESLQPSATDATTTVATAAQQEQKQPTRYTLRGVVVHHGQASAGHYYSYILRYRQETNTYHWYKYDDTDVAEVQMESPDFEQSEWFGGEFTPKYSARIGVGPAMRFWSAYMLFYEREDFQDNHRVNDICRTMQSVLLTDNSSNLAPCPPRIASEIYAQNVEHFHLKMQMNRLFERFMSDLAHRVCTPFQNNRVLALPGKPVFDLLRLLVQFCFDCRFHTRQNNWNTWAMPFFELLKLHPSVRYEFTQRTFLSTENHCNEFLFKCPYPGVRLLYGTLMVFIAYEDVVLYESNDSTASFYDSYQRPDQASPDFATSRADPLSPKFSYSPQSTEMSLHDSIIQKLIDELPNCFQTSVDSSLGNVYGPQPNSYWSSPTTLVATPSSYDQRLHIDARARGGQLLSLLLDYARSSPAAARHLLRLDLPIHLLSFMLDREPTTLIGSNSMSSFDNHHHDRTKILIRYIARIYRSFGMAIPEGSFIDFQTDPPLFGASFRLLAACQLATEGAGNQSLLNSNSQSSHDFLVLGPTPIFVTVEKEGQVTPAQAAAVRPSLLQMTPATYVRLSAVNTFFELLACLLRKQRDLYSASEYLTEPLIAPNRSTKFLQVLFNYCLNAANLHSVIDLVKTLTQENAALSRLVIDELVRVIFGSSSHGKDISTELAIPVFMEALAVPDSLQEHRMNYAFQVSVPVAGTDKPTYDVLGLTNASHPADLNSLGMQMMRALCNMLIHFEFFRQYFVSNRHIGVFFFSIIDQILRRPASSYNRIPAIDNYRRLLDQAKQYLPTPSIEVNEDDNPDDEDDDDEPDGEVDDLGDDVEEETEDDSGVRTEESSGGTGGVGSSSGGDTMSPNLNECNANLDSTEDSHVN